MINLAICGQSLGCFAILVLVTTVTTTYTYCKTNNEYRIMKNQTKGADYEKKVFRLWFPFFALLLFMLLLCLLPFFIIDKPEYF